MKIYKEHKGIVVGRGKFEHVMALTLNPVNTDGGLIRCITKREGNLEIKGYTDRSILCKIRSLAGLEKYEISQPLIIEGSDQLVRQLQDKDHDFIGFEDPDLILDSKTNLLHLYFTIPLVKKSEKVDNLILLGHAVGKNLDNLKMTAPVLSVAQVGKTRAKELSLAPVNSQGVRLNLVESEDKIAGISYSTVRVAIAKDFRPEWEFGQTVFHPKYDGFPWCAGHASPGPLLPKEFIDLGEDKIVGILNGREANTFVGGQTKYGMFSVGLFIYDFEKGKIEWVSPKPIIIDSQATTITFASYFIQTKNNEGILYAHVDDSFVRAYTLYSEGIKNYVMNHG
jgi:hypothetical protein